MKNERKTEIKVGITTLLALIIFIWLMGWAKNFMISSNDMELVINFDNVSGLEVDDNVTVLGLKKGFVKDIYLDNNKIVVVISIDENIDLRKDAKFFLASTDVMGGKKIEIVPGISDETLNWEEVQSGIFQPDLSSLMGTIGEMKEDFMTIVNEFKITLTSVNTYLADDKLKDEFISSFENFHSLTEKLNLMLDENGENLSIITKNTAELTSNANSFFTKNNEDITYSVKKLGSVLNEADSLFNRLNSFSKEIKEQKNNIGKALYNDSLMVNISNVLSDMKILTEIILQQIQEDGVKVDANIW